MMEELLPLMEAVEKRRRCNFQLLCLKCLNLLAWKILKFNRNYLRMLRFTKIYLGDGAYSSVYRVKRIYDGEEYALKKVKLHHLSDKEKENAINEVRILASLKNPNII
jgi:hypothetical protein